MDFIRSGQFRYATNLFLDLFVPKFLTFFNLSNRYDFKPASVDSTQMATLDVQSGQVTIAVPHSDGASVNVFSGPRKPYAKECVLIIDPDTGECVLEKLTSSINVKKTR